MRGYNSSNGEWCQSCEEWKKSINGLLNEGQIQ